MLRIAHVISASGVGGAERIVAALVGGGATRQWEQLVIAPFVPRRLPEFEKVVAPAAYLEYRASVPRHFARVRRRTGRALHGFRPDLVHVHLPLALALVASLPRQADEVRVLTHHHGNHFGVHGAWYERLIDRTVGRRFDRVVAVSEAVESFLIETYGYPADKVVVIRNGWDGTPRVSEPDRGRFTLVSVGNLRREKGHDVLLNALARAVRQAPDLHLILVGDGPLRARLVAYATELGIGEHVEFTGWVDDVWPYLARAQTFVFPSLSEPLGIAPMEAMAAGLSVIASAVGGIPEIIGPQVGDLVPPGDAEKLAQAIVHARAADEERQMKARNASRAAAHLHNDATVARYFDLYRALLRDTS